MNPDHAIALVAKWPEDRSVPQQLAEGIKESRNQTQKAQLGMLVEVLIAASETQEDLALIQEHFE
jgi:hypothetical protein